MGISDNGEKRWNGKLNSRGDKRGCIVEHGMSGTRIYSCWTDIKRRCYNPKNKRFSRYGGRGISVCEEWRDSFKSFYDWSIKNGYNDSLTIDRIDINKGYSPDNCRWVSAFEQQSNTSRSHYITINGVTKTISQWAREYNISPDLIKDRINKLHWNDVEAVTTPKLRMGGKRWLPY